MALALIFSLTPMAMEALDKFTLFQQLDNRVILIQFLFILVLSRNGSVRKRSSSFSVSLPQTASAFVSEMSIVYQELTDNIHYQRHHRFPSQVWSSKEEDGVESCVDIPCGDHVSRWSPCEPLVSGFL